MVGIKIEINFLFLRTTSVAKSTYEPKWESAQNIGTKSVFLPIYIYIYIYGQLRLLNTDSEGYCNMQLPHLCKM